MKYLLSPLFLLISLWSMSQYDSVSLGNIKKSFCLTEMYYRPQMIAKSFNGDTMKLTFAAGINCGGFQDPTVRISEDSVLIDFHYGAISKTPCNEITNEQKGYLQKYSSLVPYRVKEPVTTTCDCFYLFDLELYGISSKNNYCYYFNDQYLGDTTTKTSYKFYVNIGSSESFEDSRFGQGMQEIFTENSELKEVDFETDFRINTLTSKIERITLRGKSKNKSIEKKILKYLKGRLMVVAVLDPLTGKALGNYITTLSYDGLSHRISFQIYCPVAF